MEAKRPTELDFILHSIIKATALPLHPVWIPSLFYNLSKTFPSTWRFSPFVLTDLVDLATKITEN